MVFSFGEAGVDKKCRFFLGTEMKKSILLQGANAEIHLLIGIECEVQPESGK